MTLLRKPVGSAAGTVRLDVAATRARAGARRAVLDDHHVPELGPRSEEAPRRDHAAAHARPEGQHHEVLHALARPVPKLRVRRTAGVVLEPDGQFQATFHFVAEADVPQWDVDRAERDAGPVVDPRRDPEPDSTDALVRERPNDVRELVQQRGLRCRHRRLLDRLVHPSRPVDDAGEDLRPAEVDADHTISLHIRSVT